MPINEETRKKYGITGYPTILFISSDGGVITKKVGYAPPENFAPVMEEALKEETKFQETLAKLKEMPDDVELNREIAIFYLKRQQIEKAIPISEKVPNDPELNGQFALTYFEMQQLEKALPFSVKVFAKDPKNSTGLLPKLHIQLGLAYARLLQVKSEDETSVHAQKAMMHFQKIIDKYPKSEDYEPAQYYLGVTYLLNQQFDKSIEVFEKLMNHTTNDQIKGRTGTMIKRVKELAAEAEDKSDN